MKKILTLLILCASAGIGLHGATKFSSIYEAIIHDDIVEDVRGFIEAGARMDAPNFYGSTPADWKRS